MAGNLNNRVKIHNCLDPVSVTSDGATGTAVEVNGFNRIFVLCEAGLVATGDSDDTMGFQVYFDATKVASDTWATSDATAITAALATVGPSADTDTALGMETIEIDAVTHGWSTGLVNVVATAAEGGAIASACQIMLYRPNKPLNDSDNPTITYPAAS